MKKENARVIRLVMFIFTLLVGLFIAFQAGGSLEALGLPGLILLFFLPTLIQDWFKKKKLSEDKRGGEGGFRPIRASDPAGNTGTVPQPVQPAPKVEPKPAAPQPVRTAPKAAPKPAGPSPLEELEGRRLTIYSEGAHGDQVEFCIHDGEVMVEAWNDGFPNPGGGGGGSALFYRSSVVRYSHAKLTAFVRENFPWLSGFQETWIVPAPEQVRAFFAPLIELRQKWWRRHSDGYYHYVYDWNTGGLRVGHQPVDRMGSDPVEEYDFTREELRGMSIENFVQRFSWAYQSHAAYGSPNDLCEWLNRTGVAFVGNAPKAGPQPAPKAEPKPAPKPKAPANPPISAKDLMKGLENRWHSDWDRFFGDIKIDGDWKNDPYECWCDFRDGDEARLENCLRNKAFREKWQGRWFMVIGEGQVERARALDEQLGKRFRNWRFTWLIHRGKGTAKDEAALWHAPFEDVNYHTMVEFAGYSHDGSGDYYATHTCPVESK